MLVKTCKNHGELAEKHIRAFMYRGYLCKQCRLCNAEKDKKRIRRKIEKTPEQKEKDRLRAKIYAEGYKERRRVVANALYQKKKNDPEFRKKQNHHSKNKYERSKILMNDSYIKKNLKVYAKATPEMIEAKRLQLLEFRRVKKEKLLKEELIKKEIENKAKERELKGIVKICKVHGELLKEDCYLSFNGKVSEKKYYFCKVCSIEQGNIYYHNNAEKVHAKHRLYTQNNKEKVRERGKRWVTRLPDKYVIKFIIKDSKIKAEDIPPEMIETKRGLIKLKRKIKEKRHDNN